MKFQQLPAFEKHLEKATPDHLSRAWLVAIPCACERKMVCETICSAIRKKENAGVVAFDGKEVPLAKIREELDTVSFLNGQSIVIVDEADKLKKNALEALAGYAIKPSPFAYLILAAASFKALSALYEQGKKELVVCDLSAEKPWERKERLKMQLIKLARVEGKTIAREALDILLERVGTEFSTLMQEITKLLCYCKDKREISGQDVFTLCGAEKAPSVWNLSEAIVWQGRIAHGLNDTFELSLFLFLIGQVRSHLQQGMLLSLHLAKGWALHEATLAFFKPQLLEKIIPLAKARPIAFFKEGLALVFEMEMLAKNSSLSPSFLLDLLIAKMKTCSTCYPMY